MKIDNQVSDPTVQQACKLVEKHYKDRSFLKLVKGVSQYNHTRDTAAMVADKIKDSQLQIFVKSYTSKNPWSLAIGYAKGNEIFLNTRKMDLPLGERAGNIMHEAMHLLGYTHRGNRPNTYNKGTVPYKVGNLFGEYVAKK